MKNAMKKLMAFALVAVMLIGALPFAASAAINEDGFYEVPVKDTDGTTHGTLRFAKNAKGEYVISDSVTMAIATAGYRSEDVVEVTFRDGNYEKSTIDGTYSAEQLANSNVTALVSRKDTDTNTADRDGNIQGDVDVNSNVYHEVEFIDMYGKTVAVYEVKDGDNLKETLNADLTKIQASAVASRVPAGYEFAGWKESSSNNYFTTKTVYHSNVTYIMVTQAVETEPDNDNAGSNDNNNAGSNDNNNAGSNDDDTEYAWAYIYVGNDDSATKIYKNENAFSIAKVVNAFDDYDTDRHYAFDYYVLDGGTTHRTDDTDVILPGQTAHIRVKVTESKLNDNKVYLQIYLNNDFDTPAKTLNVTTMASEDGLYLYGNVEDLILDYFTAKNSNGVKLDGMYVSKGSWVADFLEDSKVARVSADEIIEDKEKTWVVYNIMVTNAKLSSSSSNADTTNPKTGDEIFVPVAMMAVTASALAAVAFYLNKKRAV